VKLENEMRNYAISGHSVYVEDFAENFLLETDKIKKYHKNHFKNTNKFNQIYSQPKEEI